MARLLCLLTTAILLIPTPLFASSDCTLYVLQKRDDGLRISSIQIAENATHVLSMAATSGNIALLMPFGLGKSGEIAQRARQPVSALVRCHPGAIQTTYQWANDLTKTLPEVDLASWATYDMRINVTAFDGVQQAFWIRGGQEVAHAEGPILDMFGGQVPLQTGDYSITTEVMPHAQLAALSGAAPLVFDGAHFFVEAVQPGQASQTWIVDLGATGSVIAASVLPKGTPIRQLEQIEHSPAGTKSSQGTMEGFGGTIGGFQGRAVLRQLKIGSLQVDSLTVGVLDALPNIGGRNPVGILGLDVLRRADVLTLAYSDTNPTITWGTSPQLKQPTIETLFSLAYGHVFVEGTINDQPATILLDTGARLSFIASRLMEMAELTPDPSQTQFVAGLDGKRHTVQAVPNGTLRLGMDTSFPISMYVGPIPVLSSIGLEDEGILLGNDWLGTFKYLELDFTNRRLRLAR